MYGVLRLVLPDAPDSRTPEMIDGSHCSVTEGERSLICNPKKAADSNMCPRY